MAAPFNLTVAAPNTFGSTFTSDIDIAASKDQNPGVAQPGQDTFTSGDTATNGGTGNTLEQPTTNVSDDGGLLAPLTMTL